MGKERREPREELVSYLLRLTDSIKEISTQAHWRRVCVTRKLKSSFVEWQLHKCFTVAAFVDLK